MLDDLWNEEDERHFNFLPPIDSADNGSRLLISTRVRGLLKPDRPGGVSAIEVGLPSPSEAIRIVMNAAEMGDQTAPVEASQIVEICGRLPLALRLAGRLIVSLGLGSAWAGVPDLLKTELADGESMSLEISATITIRASVAAISGSESEVANVKNLFRLFGLVPEDTIAPLEVLQLLFEAVTGRKTTVLHIRKWIKILLDRCLILGHVDRPQLHDLVLDYCLTQFTPPELRAAHTAVVNAFREKRTVSVSKLRGWDLSNRDHELTRYCVAEIKHHIACAIDDGADAPPESVDGYDEWLVDVPADCISKDTACVLGTDTVAAMAKAAMDGKDHWRAACIFHVVGNAVVAAGGNHGDGADHWVASLEQIDAFRSQAGGAVSGKLQPPSQLMLDFLEMKSSVKIMTSGQSERGDTLERFERLVEAPAMALEPETGVIAQFVINVVPAWITRADYADCGKAALDCMKYTVKQAATSRDPLVKTRLKILSTIFVGMLFDFALSHHADETIAVCTREILIESYQLYEYEVHHGYFLANFAQDFNVYVFQSDPLLLLWGAVEDCREILARGIQLRKKCEEEGDGAIEGTTTCIGLLIHLSLLNMVDPNRTVVPDEWQSCLHSLETGWNWEVVDVAMRELCELWKGALRLSETAADDWTDTANADEVQMRWCMKFLYLLVSEDCAAVKSKAEVLRTLPDVKEFSARCRSMENGCPLHAWVGFSPYLFGALAMEAIGEDQLALAWAATGLDTEPRLGGDPKGSSILQLRLLRARAIARRGLPGDDIKAAAEFEATAKSAKDDHSQRFLHAQALAQLKAFVPNKATVAHGRELDAAVGRLHSEPAVIHELLVGPGTQDRGLVR